MQIRPPRTTPDRNKRSAVDFRAAKLEKSRGKNFFYRGEQGYGPAAAGEPRLWRGARHGPLATTLQDRQARRKFAKLTADLLFVSGVVEPYLRMRVPAPFVFFKKQRKKEGKKKRKTYLFIFVLLIFYLCPSVL